jgi:hypothetical protein
VTLFRKRISRDTIESRILNLKVHLALSGWVLNPVMMYESEAEEDHTDTGDKEAVQPWR